MLFINNRSVECLSIKKRIQSIYAEYLPKGSYPFCYLNVIIKSENVDVNVHPTKNEVLKIILKVRFLNESEIVEIIGTTIQSRLLESNSSRVFHIQTLLPSVKSINECNKGKENIKITENKLIRTDHKSQKLDLFFEKRENTSQIEIIDHSISIDCDNIGLSSEKHSRKYVNVCLSSILELSNELNHDPGFFINIRFDRITKRKYFCRLCRF